MHKPIIGIVAKYRSGDKTKDGPHRVDTRIRNEVKQAVFDNGGIAIGIISPNAELQLVGDDWQKYADQIDAENLIRQIELCDGIILQGGDTNEALEPFIAKYCYDHDIPCLGICAGQNNVVRGLGGTTCEVSNPEKHYRLDKEYVHKCFVDITSKAYAIAQEPEIMVNSRHKRTVGETSLDKVGFCEDGYADIVEDKSKTFYMGVRFHPESLYRTDENMNRFFEAFIAACRKD